MQIKRSLNLSGLFWYSSGMVKIAKFLKSEFPLLAISAFWLIDLLNPVFKKYDYGAEFPLVLVFGVLLLILAIVEFKKARENNPVEKLFLLLFGLFVILSFVFSQTRNVGFSEVLAFLTMIMLYLIYAGQKIDWMEKFLKVVKIGAGIAVILAFVLYFWKEEPRMVGPFFNILYHANVWPNAFALFLVMVWPLFIIYKKEKSIAVYVYKFLALAFVLSALFMTFSRGALIVFVGQLILFGIYFIRRINIKTVLLIILTGILVAGIFVGTEKLRSLNHKVIDVENRLTFSGDEGLTSKQERMDFWKGAMELIKEKPVFGWGPFSFRYAYNPIQKTLLGNSDHPHNIFLKIGAENGLIALFAFLAFLFAIFIIAAKRFWKLEQSKKDLTLILGVSVSGAFAHNLIDYNFNFYANFLLLFIFLIFIRSLLVQKTQKKKNYLALILVIPIAILSLYEGSLLTLDKVATPPQNFSFLDYSFFPRNSYLAKADKALNSDDFKGALNALNKQISLNPLDSQAWHLKGVIFCNPEYSTYAYNYIECNDLIAQAIQLNPMNDFSYYVDYLRPLADRNLIHTFDVLPGRYSVYYTINKALALLDIYFDYVENNVHFTAYTPNVESAAQLVDMIVKNGYPSDEAQKQNLLNRKGKMLQTAKKLRAEKIF